MAKYLRKCIESIINQTYANIEIILINDGSTDNSGVMWIHMHIVTTELE